MHECPGCGSVCYCDLDDSCYLSCGGEMCVHECEEYDDPDDYDGESCPVCDRWDCNCDCG